MRTDIAPLADPTLQTRTGVTVTLYDSGTYADLIQGTAGLETRDLTPYAASVRQSFTQADVTLRWHSEFEGTAHPRIGQLVRIAVQGTVVFTGQIDSVSADRVSRGERTCSLAIRRRDATRTWRELRRITDIFSVGVDLAGIARNVAATLGLADAEYYLPDVGVSLVHESAQLADLSAWDMFTTALQPALREPYVDALGMLRMLNRNVLRAPDLVLPDAQVISIDRAAARAPLTTFRVKWLDPLLTKITQQEQQLTRSGVMLAVGFFSPDAAMEVYWSEDRHQRADLTRLVVRQSASTWGFSVSETYTQTSDYGGRIALRMDDVMPAMAILALIGTELAAGSAIGAIPYIGGTINNAILMVILRELTHIAAGVYEVWGVPFDHIHTVNESIAYNENAQQWEEIFEEVQNDLVPNDLVAQNLAVNELVYRAKSAAGASLSIADDLRIERGDMLGLVDGRRFYVLDGKRDLSRGAAPVLDLEGMFL